MLGVVRLITSVGAKLFNQACLALTFLPQPLSAGKLKIKKFSQALAWLHKRKKMAKCSPYLEKCEDQGIKKQSLALVHRSWLRQVTRLPLSTCKITRWWVTGNMDLSRSIMSNQSHFLQWKGNRSCGQQRSSSVIHLNLSILSATFSHDSLTGKLRKYGWWMHCTMATKPAGKQYSETSYQEFTVKMQGYTSWGSAGICSQSGDIQYFH